MSTNSKMNSKLSLVYHEDTQHPTTPVSNMPFDESIEFRNSDYILSETMDMRNEMEECRRLAREDVDAYDQVFQNQMISSTKEEDILDEIEQRTYKGVYYADSMDMEEAMRQDVRTRELKRLSLNGTNLGDGNIYK